MKIDILKTIGRTELEKVFKDTDVICKHCKGIGLNIEKLKKGEIGYCNHCGGTGIYEFLGECGKMHKTVPNYCADCSEAKEKESEKKFFEKAVKIKPENFDGHVAELNGNRITSIEEYLEEYEEKFENDFPKWIYPLVKEYSLNLDLEDELINRADDNGYEEMSGDLNFKDEDIIKAQELVDKWLKKQNAVSYNEDKSRVIDLSDIYEECLKKLKNKKKEIEKMGDELCKYCRIEEPKKHAGPHNLGCEGLLCDEAYENYLDEED